MMFCFFFNLLILSSVYSIDVRVDPIVVLDQGIVRGIRSSDGNFSSFLGVPYASVDLDNPFGPSKPYDRFNLIYNAYNGSIKCPQPLSTPQQTSGNVGTLDCLTLNIYSPILAGTQNPHPVLVWIHGGDFLVGSAGDYDPENLVRQGIVVVTINYRLGPYGFMCLDIPSIPGNQGLKDQYEALVWIRNNIRHFGGNAYNVTIGGQGAGSTSALLHLYSDKYKLYHKVILESGTPQNIGSFVNADVEAAQKLALQLGSNITDTYESLAFLQTVDPNLVASAASELNLQLKPCRERSFSGVNNFVENEPYNLSNERKVRNTPVLIGHTSKERLNSLNLYGDNYFRIDPFYEIINENYNLDENQLIEAANILRHFYIGDLPISRALTSELETFESDVMVNHPVQRTITNLLRENANPIYEYEFGYVSDTEAEGAASSEELKYLFEMPDSNIDNNVISNLVRSRMLSMWTNFVKYGNPTPVTNELLNVRWTPVTNNTRPYLAINSEMTLKRRINYNRMAFLDLLHSSYGRYHKYARQC